MRHLFGSGDFDVEDRVAASEGEQIVGVNGFGAYGDDDDFGNDEADFGNVGLDGLYDDSMGEIDTYDTLSFGDFDDGDFAGETMGAGFMSKIMRKAPMKAIAAAKKSPIAMKKATPAVKLAAVATSKKPLAPVQKQNHARAAQAQIKAAQTAPAAQRAMHIAAAQAHRAAASSGSPAQAAKAAVLAAKTPAASPAARQAKVQSTRAYSNDVGFVAKSKGSMDASGDERTGGIPMVARKAKPKKAKPPQFPRKHKPAGSGRPYDKDDIGFIAKSKGSMDEGDYTAPPPKPLFTSSQAPIAEKVVEKQQNILKSKVHQFQVKNKNRIEQAQRRALAAGKPIPPAIAFIPPAQRQQMVAEATKQAAIITKAQDVAPSRSGVPIPTVATVMNQHSPGPNISSQSSQGVVVTPEQAVNDHMAMKSAIQSSPMVVRSARSQYAHPMLAVMNPMGEYEEGAMGFKIKIKKPKILKKVTAAVKKSVVKAMPKPLAKAVAKVEATVKNVTSTVTDVAKSLVTKPPKSQAEVEAVTEVAAAVQEGAITPADGALQVAAVQAAAQPNSPSPFKSASPYAHPMLRYSGAFGEDGQMGFDLSSFLKDAKAQASLALKKATEDAKAKLMQRGAEAASGVAAKLLADKKVQSVVKAETQKAAANTVAEKLLQPEFQKKAGIAVGVAALGVGFLAWKAMKK